jgi:hypothetical protein
MNQDIQQQLIDIISMESVIVIGCNTAQMRSGISINSDDATQAANKLLDALMFTFVRIQAVENIPKNKILKNALDALNNAFQQVANQETPYLH